MIRGLDCASVNGLIDWQLPKERGIQFIMYRKTLYLWQDKYFIQNYEALLNLRGNILPCVYANWCPQYDRKAQFEILKKDLSPINAFRVMVDIERVHSFGVNSPKVLGDLLWFLNSVQDWHGTIPIIYTSKYKWNTYYSNKPGWGEDWPLMVASWSARQPTLPIGWDDWLVWQYSSAPNALGPFYGFKSVSADLDIAKDSFLAGG